MSTEAEYKTCIKCKGVFPKTEEYFNKNIANKDGFNGKCKKCMAEYRKQYYEKNVEKIKNSLSENREQRLVKKRQYYQDKKEQILEYAKQYRESAAEQRAEYRKKYYQENREYFIEKSRKYRKDNAEYVRERNNRYYKQNSDKVIILQNRREAKKRELPRTLSAAEWEASKQYFNYKCAYCGREEPLTQDHFVPLSKGGEYTRNNIIPACKSCNCKKNNKDFFEWYRNEPFYSKESEERILRYLDFTDNTNGNTLEVAL